MLTALLVRFTVHHFLGTIWTWTFVGPMLPILILRGRSHYMLHFYIHTRVNALIHQI
jgi:hypothetical protein